MTTYQAESFYRAKITSSITAGATCPITVRVSKLPTLTNALLTVSPNTESEEIVEYNNPNPTNMTIDIIKRGIKPSSILLSTAGVDYNNTTYQKDHTQNDIIRGDVTHIHINQGIGNTTLASNVGVGIVRLATAPVSSSDPIVVWDNDPRLWARCGVGYYALTTANTSPITVNVGFQPKLVRVVATTSTFGSQSNSTTYYNWSTSTTYGMYTEWNQNTNTTRWWKLDSLPSYCVTLRNYDWVTSQTMSISTCTINSTWFVLSAPNWAGITNCNLWYEIIA